jgi:hypothetical protein
MRVVRFPLQQRLYSGLVNSPIPAAVLLFVLLWPAAGVAFATFAAAGGILCLSSFILVLLMPPPTVMQSTSKV